MHVRESTAELRRICQASREEEYYRMPWLERNITRRVSIYLTRVFLEMGISANQASLIGLAVAIVGGAFLIFHGPGYWLVGIALLGLCEVLGNVDGEVARYRKSSSPQGAFWNSMPEHFVWLYTPVCLSFGLYNALNRIDPFVIGFVAVLSLALTMSALLLPYPILYRKGLLPPMAEETSTAPAVDASGSPLRYVSFLSHYVTLLSALMVATVLDLMLPSLAVGPVAFNVRYVVFIFFAAVWAASAVRQIYLPLRAMELRL